MFEILTKTFYGNTLLTWLSASVLILLSFVSGKVIYTVFSGFLKKLTEKTETKWDDILIDGLNIPLTFIITIFGLRVSLNILTLPPSVETWISKIFHVLIVLNISWLLSRLIDSIFKEILLPFAEKTESDLDDLIFPLLRKGFKTIVWSMGIIVGLNNAGYDVGALIAGLGIGGVAIALAARNTLSNIFGGITIFIDQPFRINDKIKLRGRVRGLEGKVAEVGLRQTKLITDDGYTLIIPNSTFANDAIENTSTEPFKRNTSKFIISLKNSYEKITQAMFILANIAKEDPDIENKDIIVGVSGIDEKGVNLIYIYSINKNAISGIVQTRVNLKIIQEFGREQIEWAVTSSDPDNYD
ncbi:MAG: mechanosensitive ion channel [Leptospiraceae bacterium]|nr:mechanosensitive ion channel [Leptospiraceae bacterium]MCP5512101.1 mechanosensitive ion channel [Leptospiraceae bacterium]